MAFFFNLAADSIPADPQHAGHITHPRSVDSHLRELLFNYRVAGFIGVKGHKRPAAVTATIPLGTTAGLAKTLYLLSESTMLANNRL